MNESQGYKYTRFLCKRLFFNSREEDWLLPFQPAKLSQRIAFFRNLKKSIAIYSKEWLELNPQIETTQKVLVSYGIKELRKTIRFYKTACIIPDGTRALSFYRWGVYQGEISIQ